MSGVLFNDILTTTVDENDPLITKEAIKVGNRIS